MTTSNGERSGGANVLLVDDHEAVRMVLSILLSVHEGVDEVREAADGLTAIDICTRFAPDLVVLDFWMPGLDGAETAKRIREMHPSVHIVAHSAVLDSIPEWADALFVKGDLPDADYLLDLLRTSPPPTAPNPTIDLRGDKGSSAKPTE